MALSRSGLVLSLWLAGLSSLPGCHDDKPIVDYRCGPWTDVATDVLLPPLGLSVNDALARLKPSYLLEGPPLSPDLPGSRGRLIVEVETEDLRAGAVKAQASTAEYPRAPIGQCGVRAALTAQFRTPDGIITAQGREVTLQIGEPDAVFTAELPGTLPPPYPAREGMSLEVRISLASSTALAHLRLPDASPAWTWSGRDGAP